MICVHDAKDRKEYYITPEALLEGYRRVLQTFYSPTHIAKHLVWSLGVPPLMPKRILFFFLWNLAHRTLHRQVESVLASLANLAELAPSIVPDIG